MSGEYREVHLDELTNGKVAHAVRNQPMRHESLPDSLLVRIKATYDAIGWLQRDTLEQWELGFMKDTHPERELRAWEKLAKAFKSYCDQRGTPDIETQQRLVEALVRISYGSDPKGVASPVRAKLRECWKAVN